MKKVVQFIFFYTTIVSLSCINIKTSEASAIKAKQSLVHISYTINGITHEATGFIASESGLVISNRSPFELWFSKTVFDRNNIKIFASLKGKIGNVRIPALVLQPISNAYKDITLWNLPKNYDLDYSSAPLCYGPLNNIAGGEKYKGYGFGKEGFVPTQGLLGPRNAPNNGWYIADPKPLPNHMRGWPVYMNNGEYVFGVISRLQPDNIGLIYPLNLINELTNMGIVNYCKSKIPLLEKNQNEIEKLKAEQNRLLRQNQDTLEKIRELALEIVKKNSILESKTPIKDFHSRNQWLRKKLYQISLLKKERTNIIAFLEKGNNEPLKERIKKTNMSPRDEFEFAETLQNEGNLIEAQKYYERAYTKERTNPKYFWKYYRSNFNLARFEKANQLLSRYYDVIKNNASNEKESRRIKRARADLYVRIGRFQDAENIYLKLAPFYEKFPDSFQLASFYSWLGSMYQNWGQYIKAEPLLKHALRIVEKRKHITGIANSLSNLAYLETLLDKKSKIEERLLRAQQIFSQTFHPRSYKLIPSLNNLARYYIIVERFSEAEELLNEAQKIGQIKFGMNYQHSARTLDLLSFLELQNPNGSTQKACDYAQASLSIKEKIFGSQAFEYGFTLIFQAKCKAKLDNLDDAFLTLENAQRIITNTIGNNAPEIAEIKMEKGQILKKINRPSLAYSCFLQAFAIRKRSFGLLHRKTLASRKAQGSIPKEQQYTDFSC